MVGVGAVNLKTIQVSEMRAAAGLDRGLAVGMYENGQ